MLVNLETRTNGKGLWTDEKRTVLINKIDIGYTSLTYYPEGAFNGELRAYFSPDGYSSGSWNTSAYGLIYTDKLWLREFKRGLRKLGFSVLAVRDIEYSERGQSSDYVSMDIGPNFYASWKRLTKLKEIK